MPNSPLIPNPLFPPIPDRPTGIEDPELQEAVDNIWRWMEDITLQLKNMLGNPQP